MLLAGCAQSEEVQILANNQVIWSSPLGSNRLEYDSQLGISQYKHPAKTLTVDVDSPARRTELLFFPFDPKSSFDLLVKASSSAPTVPVGNSVRYLHQGGAASYGVGAALVLANGLKPQSIRGVYQRRHGECELEVSWNTLFKEVLAQVDDSSGEGDCNGLFCPDYDVHYTQRAATSYLRQKGVNGQGGFGLFIRGGVEFDSPVIDDLSFHGKAGYDISLPGDEDPPELPRGLPIFKVSAGPFAGTWDCSPSPFTTCPHTDVRNDVRGQLSSATTKLNAIIAECATAPFEASCETAADCDDTFQAQALANGARTEAQDRGMSLSRANEFSSALRSPDNWRCTPVTKTCADLFGVEPIAENVCQLELRATDVVAMPNSFSLVWYPGDPGQNPVTAAQGLYLGLTELGLIDQLAQLCSPAPATRARAFVRLVDNSSH